MKSGGSHSSSTAGLVASTTGASARKRYIGGLLPDIISGAVAGVIAGLVVVLLMDWREQQQLVEERQEQIAFLRNLMDSMQLSCQSAKEYEMEFGDGRVFTRTADQMRYFYLKEGTKHLGRVLEGRTNQLSFDELYELELVHSYIAIVLENNSDGSGIDKSACVEPLIAFRKSSVILDPDFSPREY